MLAIAISFKKNNYVCIGISCVFTLKAAILEIVFSIACDCLRSLSFSIANISKIFEIYRKHRNFIFLFK